MVNESFFTLACAGLIGSIFGLLLAFFGYRLFLVLLPIWGFFFGLWLGADTMQVLFGEGFPGNRHQLGRWVRRWCAFRRSIIPVLLYRRGGHFWLTRLFRRSCRHAGDRYGSWLLGLVNWPYRWCGLHLRDLPI